MTEKTNFTTEEWEQLIAAPISASVYVMVSDPSITGLIKEMKAMATTMKETAPPAAAQGLIQEVLEFIEKNAKNKEKIEIPELQNQANIDALLKNLEKTALILDAKTTPEEATGYKKWILDVAQAVANASKEGGFLGFGGSVQVSDKEKSALAAIKQSLNYN
jgi:hypothetical protein